jgi:uncharacterized protein (TIGR02284 family)
MQDYTALKETIGICRAAEQGFRGAANSVKTPTMRDLFEQYSEQRAEFANELMHAGRSLGLEVDDPVGLSGVLHAGWMELKGVLTGHSEHQILEECERGEDLSLKTYRQALNMNINQEIRQILQRQVSDIEIAHAKIRSLRTSIGRDIGVDQTRKAH